MKVVSFSWRQARREWRAGELRTLAAALVVAVAALAAVSAFTQRVEKALASASNELLAADLVVRSRQWPDLQWRDEAERRGLQTATVVEFPSVVFAGEPSMLVQVKAVSDRYPLRGRLAVADEAFGAPYETDQVPARGQAWVDNRVLNELATAIGQPLVLGEQTLSIEQIIALEPDRGGGAFSLAPRVLINTADLEESGLLGPGSRARYRFLLAGSETDLSAFRDWLQPQLRAGQYFQSLEDSQQQIAGALDRAQRFLSLAALTAIILAGVAIVIATNQFARRHFDAVAILRCLGERQRPVLTAFALMLLWIGLPAMVIGCILGYAGQWLLVVSMGELLPEGLPLPDAQPALASLATGLLVLLGYGLPPLLRLRQIPPMRVLNRQLGEPRAGVIGAYLAAGVFSAALIIWQARDLTLGLAVTAGLVLTTVALGAAAWVLTRLLRRIGRGRASWRLGLASAAKGQTGQLQLAGLGLGLLAILMLSVVQRDLLQGWRGSLPADTPNFFLINIQPDQVASTQQYLRDNGVNSAGLFPMAVARLSQINGEVPDPTDYADPRADSRLRGNINVSWADEFPAANRLVKGQWWSGSGPEVSLAESWARVLNLDVGDSLSFVIGSSEITAKVASIREVDWDSMQVNFFILLSPETVDGVGGEIARTYLSSLYLPAAESQLVGGLVRQHPNISAIDVTAILDRVTNIINRVSQTVQLVFVLTLAAGALVLIAGLQSSLDERIYSGAVLRTLGGSRRQLARATLIEFGSLGLTAGLVASVAALIIGWALAERVFQMPYTPSWEFLLLGAVGAVVLITGVGWWGSRPVTRTPPMRVLRKN